MLVLQDTPDTEFASTGLTVTSVPVHNGGAKCDLVLEVTPIADGYRLVLEFNASLFLPETAERLLRHFTRLLEQACAAPETLLASLSMMDASEARQMLSFINADDVAFSEYSNA
jgi:non-ribosomal peptide synthetase component F